MRIAATALLAALALTSRADAQDRFNAIWGTGPTDVWAAGDAGMVAHYTASGWVGMNTGTTNNLRAIWASGPRDVWAVGDDGTILRMTGTAWTWVRPPVQRHFIAVGGCGASDVWVLGQSDDMSQAPVFLHFDGSNWTLERAPFPFRPAGLSLACVSGSGGGGVTVAGAALFDPRPDQRRSIGTLLRRSGGAWTSQGFDGRAMTDPQIGGSSWTSVATAGGATLLAGQNDQGVALLLSRGSSWTPLTAPTVPDAGAQDFSFTLAGDGTPITVFKNGFGRYQNGRWAITTGTISSGGMSAADQARMMQLSQVIASSAQRGQAPTQAQMEEFQRLQNQMMSAQQGMVSSAERAQSLAFGSDARVFAPTAANMFVASENRNVFRVTGDSSAAVWGSHCLVPGMAGLEPCTGHAARGAQAPAPVSGPQPQAPPEAEQTQQAAPSAPSLPSVPRVSKPRIPRP